MMRYIRCHCLDMMASTFHDGIFHDRQNVGLPHKACPVIIGMFAHATASFEHRSSSTTLHQMHKAELILAVVAERRPGLDHRCI